MKTKPLAFSIHLLTASGAALALMALVSATQAHWAAMFGWLGIAFIVDGVDGPLARMVDIKKNASNWDGVLLDLVVDYLTYVFIPAYALIYSDLLPNPWGVIAALVIALTGVIYFADVRMKEPDHSFSGFPGAWQMVVMVFLTLTPGVWVMLAIVAILAFAQFLPLKFIHPVRTRRWRPLNLTIAILWVALAGWSVVHQFDPPAIVRIGLVLSSIWLLFVGIVMQLLPVRHAVIAE